VRIFVTIRSLGTFPVTICTIDSLVSTSPACAATRETGPVASESGADRSSTATMERTGFRMASSDDVGQFREATAVRRNGQGDMRQASRLLVTWSLKACRISNDPR